METLNVYTWLILFEGIISLILSCLVLFAYWRFKRVETFAFRLVAMLAASDALNSIGYLLALFGFPVVESTSDKQDKSHHSSQDYHEEFTLESAICQLSGFLNQFSNMSTFVIMALIAYCVLITSNRTTQQQFQIAKKQPLFLLLGFGLPGIIAVIPATMTSFSPQTSFSCWLDETNTTMFVVFGVVLYFGLLWSSVAFFVYCLVMIRRVLHNESVVDLQQPVNETHYPSPVPTTKVFRRLLIFPYITLFCWVPATFLRCLDWFLDNNFQNDETSTLLLISIDMLASILNVLVYGLNPEVRREFRRFVFSRQTVEDYKQEDETDRQKKVDNNPALKSLVESSHLTQKTLRSHEEEEENRRASVVTNDERQSAQVGREKVETTKQINVTKINDE